MSEDHKRSASACANAVASLHTKLDWIERGIRWAKSPAELEPVAKLLAELMDRVAAIGSRIEDLAFLEPVSTGKGGAR